MTSVPLVSGTTRPFTHAGPVICGLHAIPTLLQRPRAIRRPYRRSRANPPRAQKTPGPSARGNVIFHPKPRP